MTSAFMGPEVERLWIIRLSYFSFLFFIIIIFPIIDVRGRYLSFYLPISFWCYIPVPSENISKTLGS